MAGFPLLRIPLRGRNSCFCVSSMALKLIPIHLYSAAIFYILILVLDCGRKQNIVSRWSKSCIFHLFSCYFQTMQYFVLSIAELSD